VKRADATLPLYTVAPLREQLHGSLARERFNTILLGTLGSIGLILAAIVIPARRATRVDPATTLRG
jgi:Co/Zn/Cd efflux system component